ncbi:MAG: hypothetical protein AAB215_03000 [Planctomycetota bacterium]
MSRRARLFLTAVAILVLGVIAAAEWRRLRSAARSVPAEPPGPPWPAGPDGHKRVPRTLRVNVDFGVPWEKTLAVLREARASGYQAVQFPDVRRDGRPWKIWLPETVPDWTSRTPLRIELDRKGGGESAAASFKTGAPRAFKNLKGDLSDLKEAVGESRPAEVTADGGLATGLVLKAVQAALNDGCPEVGLPSP